MKNLFSTRINTVLSNLRITDLDELTKYSEKDILSFRQLGPKGLKTIKEVLEAKGMKLADESDSIKTISFVVE